MAMKTGKRGLFMTILILVLFFLILGELFSFALLTMSYNGADQSSVLASSSLNYGKSLQASTGTFANASLGRALYTLANYEFNATMRKGNLISNTSQYLAYLMVNGTLPNVPANSIPANYLSKSMGNLTLRSYNSSVASLFGSSSVKIAINQTKVVIFQQNPYSLSASYVENAALNSTSGRFSYQIPVSATILLNGTPDLYYYQQGIARNVRFGQLSSLTSVIGGVNASNGNYLGSVYGPVYVVPTGAAGLTCASLSSMVSSNVPAFSFAPYNQMLILATSNAVGITNGGSGPNCVNQYGGLITYGINSISSPPAVPWLSYPSASGIVGNLVSGQQVLIFGNTLSAYSIQNLISAAGGGYYFGSPFAPSYLDSAQAYATKQNPSGIFSFASYNLQVANFSRSLSSSIYLGSNSILKPTNSLTFTLWADPGPSSCIPSNNCYLLSSGGQTGSTGIFVIFLSPNQIEAGLKSATQQAYPGAINSLPMGQWSFIAGTYNSITNLFNLYINGINIAQLAGTPGTFSSVYPGLYIGQPNNGNLDYFSGQVSNVQIFNSSLSPQQLYQMYQQGIASIPPSNSGLVGWWPLNGNANDYSGNGNNGASSNVMYSFPTNYLRDTLLPQLGSTPLSPVPGILNCNSNSQCSNTLLPHAYLGYMPLEVQSSMQVARFNGLSQSYISVPHSAALNPSPSIAVSFWVDFSSALPVVDYIQDGLGAGNAQYYIRGYNANNFEAVFVSNVRSYDLIMPYSGNLVLNQWNHLVFAVNDTVQTGVLYVNGVQKATVAGISVSRSPNTNPLTIGGYSWDGYSNSLISNVQIYGSPLSSGQVSQLYNEGIQGLPLQANSLAGWWPLNGNANDYSGNGNNGTGFNVFYPPFSGVYNSPGLSSITSVANEWQSLGIPRSGG
ncbi:MAG: LamG domain-containing protein [Candidatus Micrarchaeota archaeon]|nr:LamG domain-containing protein [Candidatus Micrarchaeota archaeon]